MDEWLLEHLVCPRDGARLVEMGASLVCQWHHSYPVVDGIPVLLVPEASPTIEVASDALDSIRTIVRHGFSTASRPAVDPFVQAAIIGTCGNLYRAVVGRLPRYPIPQIPLPPPGREIGSRLLDVGCGWGRWSISAARLGYLPVALDPFLETVRAARRVARQLEANVSFVVADARHLPFAGGAFDVAFSYSVLQHFSKEDARAALAQCGRVLRPGGRCLAQFLNARGVWSTAKRVRDRARGRVPEQFDVRYWTTGELRAAAEVLVGPASLSVDGFFTANAQLADLDLLPLPYRAVVLLSEALRRASDVAPALVEWADSVYVDAIRAA